MNENQIRRLGLILDETDSKWETKMCRQAAADYRVYSPALQTYLADRYDLIHMHMNFPFFD